MTERVQQAEERGNRIKYKRSILPTGMKATACFAMLWTAIQAVPHRAFAAQAWSTGTTAVKSGPLPLLAALGLGIVVAVGAVIAFLQMTTKGKDSYNYNSKILEDGEQEEVIAEQSIEDWNAVEVLPDEDEVDSPLTDYTIPMTKVLNCPEQAEFAEHWEPRICGIEGEHAGGSYRILNRRLTFGRDPSQCSILFPYQSSEISRVHCTLRFIEGSRTFELEDNGSSNGTFLYNGEKLQPGVRYVLRTGERFSLSGKEHLFEVRSE